MTSWSFNAADLEIGRLIDDGLDAQDGAVLVNHLDRVVPHPMFDLGSGDAFLQVVMNFGFESAVKLAAEEREDVFGTEAEGGVLDETGVELFEGTGIGERDVRGQLGLVGDPLVRHVDEQILREGIHPARQETEDPWPVLAYPPVGEALGSFRVLQPGERVVHLAVAKAVRVHLTRDVLVTVEVYRANAFRASLGRT